MGIAQALNTLMNSRGISNYALAKYLGCSQSTIKNWLTGLTSPSNEKLKMISEYFGVSADYLLGNEPNEKPHADENDMEPKEKLLLENFRDLPPEMQEFVLSSVLAQSEKLKKEQNR